MAATGQKKERPALRQGAPEHLVSSYQVLDPWHPGVPHVSVAAFQFKVLTIFFVPSACVAAFTVVVV